MSLADELLADLEDENDIEDLEDRIKKEVDSDEGNFVKELKPENRIHGFIKLLF